MENKENEYLDMIKFLEEERNKSDQKLSNMTDEQRIKFLASQDQEAINNAKENGIKTLKISRRKNG